MSKGGMNLRSLEWNLAGVKTDILGINPHNAIISD